MNPLEDSSKSSSFELEFGPVLRKICNKCGEFKTALEFYKRKRHRYGLDSWCKQCRNVERRGDYKKNPDKYQRQTKKFREKHEEEIKARKKRYYEQNKEEIREKDRKRYAQESEQAREVRRVRTKNYREQHQEEIIAHRKAHYEAHQEELKQDSKDYYEANKEYVNKRSNAYAKKRYAEDLNFKLTKSLRRRLEMAVKKGFKSGSAVRDLGCSIDFFRSYMEAQFYAHPVTGEAMTWENHGMGHGHWNLDHIVPFTAFNLEDAEQVKKVCHYTNLQPLWFEENMAKGKKLNWQKSKD